MNFSSGIKREPVVKKAAQIISGKAGMGW